MKHFITVLFVLIALSSQAAIVGPYPLGEGVPPLASAVAVVERLNIMLTDRPTTLVCSVVVFQYVSPEAHAAGQVVGTKFMGNMTPAEFKQYVLDPFLAGQIATYEEGAENWLIRQGGSLFKAGLNFKRSLT